MFARATTAPSADFTAGFTTRGRGGRRRDVRDEQIVVEVGDGEEDGFVVEEEFREE